MTDIKTFLITQASESYPLARANFEVPCFGEFFEKFGIMYREQLFRALKNLNRQRRSFKQFFRDMSILFGEANYADEICS
jgi:hypothetical protein